MRAFWGGKGGFVIEFGGVCYQDTYHDVSCVYSTSILQDTRILMYLDVSQTRSQTYLTCSVTFQENTCILIFYMYFTRIPKESNIRILCASLMSHWIHIRIHQLIRIHVLTRCIFMDSSSRYIKIHRDTKSRYMYLGRVLTTLQDTIRIQSGYMRDPCGIHAGSNDPCGIHVSAEVRGYIRDTCGILQRYIRGYMYLKF